MEDIQQSAASTMGQIDAISLVINENVAQSSTVVADISQDIALVNQAALDLQNDTQEVTVNSQDLRELAANLHELLGRFKTH